MSVLTISDEVSREILTKIVRPVVDDWSLGEQGVTAFVDLLSVLFGHGYSLEALKEMLVHIELNLDDELEA